MSRSCIGCKFLYIQDEGYSNYTVTDSSVNCALDKNQGLPVSQPFDWNHGRFAGNSTDDNWPVTANSRCECYTPGAMVTLDVDNDDDMVDLCQDVEQLVVICKHAGRAPTIDRNDRYRKDRLLVFEFQGQWLVWVEDGETTVFTDEVAARTFAAIERSNNGSTKP